MNAKTPKVLFYDIETSPLKAYIWSLGKQVVRANQLCEGFEQSNIICLAYAWDDGKAAQILDWGWDKQCSKRIIKEFDKLIEQADVVIGKNNNSFDDKYVNTQRLLHNQPGMPEWTKRTDDIEKQLRKHFGRAFASRSLDHLGKLLLNSPKVKMEFQDWVNILEKKDPRSFKKMLYYCKKDVENTRKLWHKILPHISPKFNHSTHTGDLVCKTCGSYNIKKNGTRTVGGSIHQQYYCNDHGGFAGYYLLPRNPTTLK